MPRISPEDLKERLDNGEAILVVDVRGKNPFDYRHIAGAISVPEGEVESGTQAVYMASGLPPGADHINKCTCQR